MMPTDKKIFLSLAPAKLNTLFPAVAKFSCVMSLLSLREKSAVSIVLAIERAHNNDEPKELARLLNEMRKMGFCKV